MSPIPMVLDELHRRAEAGELAITRPQPFPLLNTAALAFAPVVVLTGVIARSTSDPHALFVGGHEPTPAQLRTAVRRRWQVRACDGITPHYHCERCGCGHVSGHPLPAEVQRPCGCRCHPARPDHFGTA